MTRAEYLLRAKEFQPRGSELPQAKLTEPQVEDILSCVKQRQSMRAYINNTLSNMALAKRYGVSLRCIERITCRDAWTHVGG